MPGAAAVLPEAPAVPPVLPEAAAVYTHANYDSDLEDGSDEESAASTLQLGEPTAVATSSAAETTTEDKKGGRRRLQAHKTHEEKSKAQAQEG